MSGIQILIAQHCLSVAWQEKPKGYNLDGLSDKGGRGMTNGKNKDTGNIDKIEEYSHIM